MKFNFSLKLLLVASTALAAPSIEERTTAVSRNDIIGPKNSFKPLPETCKRHKVCHVRSHGDGKDDSDNILDALRTCNNGGRVIFDQEYTIGRALDLQFLKHIDLDITGTMKFTNDTNYWINNAFQITFQNSTTFFKLGGQDVNIYGGGTIDGNGQVWYDLFTQNATLQRPILMGIIGLEGGSIGPLKLRYSPSWYHIVANSSGVVFDGIDISGYSSSGNVAKNTDGWDTYRSDNIVIQNSVINNGDDCVAFKPNSTNILVQNLHCNGSHGISVGSLGQYAGETDIVENVLVYNISMFNASDGARIKVWPGIVSELEASLQGGGGSGSVKNVVYDTMSVHNVDWAIELTQCYGQSNQALCDEYPSNLTISDIWFKNFSGVTSTKEKNKIATLVCSSPNVCSNIFAEDINVVSPSGYNQAVCTNVDDSLLQLNCTK
ncbi:extracellular exo-polygalacturonase, putative [Talaromyces stipitatus ATCC 10500]|uniref:galacturonan 1,4-alpha-galacturonidase n=1 Tax=Talaromyces stipitatus (strain ATCC 10500 / CBS 375.48 / QM 6759 / NRRL 1006) TaxID=441959 RepID=B8ML07_TALSN|nr:extracellular exo-polygalacturonase, putative [Talaromyces stipitatus ATCC 10500]EED15423.1 extracellular exo-polygalacturonase, putative [Talaromyces stipitatus ATCC 10500]